jgi:hypothetical protein
MTKGRAHLNEVRYLKSRRQPRISLALAHLGRVEWDERV